MRVLFLFLLRVGQGEVGGNIENGGDGGAVEGGCGVAGGEELSVFEQDYLIAIPTGEGEVV